MDAKCLPPTNFQELLARGHNHNIIVYDYSGNGRPTLRLVALMKVIARRNLFSPLKTLYFPPQSFYVYDNYLNTTGKYEVGLCFEFGVDDLDLCGVKCLAYEGDLNKEYVKLGGSLPGMTMDVVLGVADNGEVILGAY
jgi:hypothetical protein